MTTLKLRTLNRTLLERQLLVSRTKRPPLDVVRQLIAMQSQEPNWPYVGLWTRIDGFQHDDLTALLEDRSVVRSTMVRATMHLAAGDDFRWLRPIIQPIIDRHQRSPYYAEQTKGLDLEELADIARGLLADQTLPRRHLSRVLGERFPGRKGAILAGAVELHTPMVHPSPGGVWGTWGTRGGMPIALAESWLGQPMCTPPRLETMIRRYLAAFGPATVMDIQAWSGRTRLREVVDALRPQLQVYRNEQGKELFDLPDSPPFADPDQPVPVRFIPAYDNLLLGHADRTRVISDEDRKQVMPGGAQVLPTFLVDGFVRGTWSIKDSTLRITPFRSLSKADTAAVLEEAEHLRPFIAAADITFS